MAAAKTNPHPQAKAVPLRVLHYSWGYFCVASFSSPAFGVANTNPIDREKKKYLILFQAQPFWRQPAIAKRRKRVALENIQIAFRVFNRECYKGGEKEKRLSGSAVAPLLLACSYLAVSLSVCALRDAARTLSQGTGVKSDLAASSTIRVFGTTSLGRTRARLLSDRHKKRKENKKNAQYNIGVGGGCVSVQVEEWKRREEISQCSTRLKSKWLSRLREALCKQGHVRRR